MKKKLSDIKLGGFLKTPIKKVGIISGLNKKTSKPKSSTDQKMYFAGSTEKGIRERASRLSALKKEKQAGLPGGVSSIEAEAKLLDKWNARKKNPTIGDRIRKVYNKLNKKK